MILADIARRAAAHHLEIVGVCQCDGEPDLPPRTKTVVFLGLAEQGEPSHLFTQPEWADGNSDPLDSWSRRVIGRMACTFRAKALFPFSGSRSPSFFERVLRGEGIGDTFMQSSCKDNAMNFERICGALALKERISDRV